MALQESPRRQHLHPSESGVAPGFAFVIGPSDQIRDPLPSAEGRAGAELHRGNRSGAFIALFATVRILDALSEFCFIIGVNPGRIQDPVFRSFDHVGGGPSVAVEASAQGRLTAAEQQIFAPLHVLRVAFPNADAKHEHGVARRRSFLRGARKHEGQKRKEAGESENHEGQMVSSPL